MRFSETVVCEIMVNVAVCRVCALSNVSRLVDQVVNLSWDGLSDHTENPTFTVCFKVNGARLHRVAGSMHLVCIIERIMHHSNKGTRSVGCT